MAALTCCGNQPTPIIIGLLVTYLTGLIDCYPLLSSSLPVSSSSDNNMNLGKMIYRPNFNSHSSGSSSVPSSSSSSSQSKSVDFSSSPSSPPQVPISIVSPSSSSSSSPSSSSSSSSQSLPIQQLPQPASSLSYHHLPSASSIPGITFIRGPVADDESSPSINRRPTYQDYLDTFRLPLMSTGLDRSNTNNNIALMTTNGLTSGKGIKSPKLIFAQPSTSQIDFDYVPYIQSDFSPPQSSYSSGSERSGSNDLYEEADYSDPIYDLKYDPIDDSNWLNEPTLSSYRQQSQQPALPPISLISPSSPYSSYSPYPLPSSSSGNSGSSSEELLTNLMVDYFVKELERNSQQQQSSEPVQHLIRLQQQQQQQHHHPQQQQQPIDELKAYEGYIEKKSSSSSSPSESSFSRDKGLSLTSASSGDNKKSINKKESDSAKRIEQRGQKEYPMLRPATENNGKDDLDNQPSLTSQLKSLSSSSSPSSPSASSTNQSAERTDDEVNQLKSLLQSA